MSVDKKTEITEIADKLANLFKSTQLVMKLPTVCLSVCLSVSLADVCQTKVCYTLY